MPGLVAVFPRSNLVIAEDHLLLQFRVEVEWARQEGGLYHVTLTIETEDQPGMIARLTEAIAKLESNIRQFEAQTLETRRGLIEVTVEVRDRAHLEKLRQVIRAVPGVLNVERRMGTGTGYRPRVPGAG